MVDLLGRRWELVMDAVSALIDRYSTPSGRARPGKRFLLEALSSLYQAFGVLGSAVYAEELPPLEVAGVLEGGEPPASWPEGERRAAREYRKTLMALAERDPGAAAVLRGLFLGYAADCRSFAAREGELLGFFIADTPEDRFLWVGGTRKGDLPFEKEVEALLEENLPDTMLPTDEDLLVVWVSGGRVHAHRYTREESVEIG